MSECCVLCWKNASMGREVHHKQPKGMGGRKREAKAVSESPENKVVLCDICHGAVHGLLLIRNGQSCRNCRRLTTCYFGRKLLSMPTDGVARPW